MDRFIDYNKQTSIIHYTDLKSNMDRFIATNSHSRK